MGASESTQCLIITMGILVIPLKLLLSNVVITVFTMLG